MIGAPELLEVATSVPASSGAESVSAIDRFLQTLAGRRPKMPSTTTRLTYPSKADYNAVQKHLITIAQSDADLVHAVEETLVKPLRAYPLEGETSGHFALISSYKESCVIICEIDVSGAAPTMSTNIMRSTDRATVAQALEDLHPGWAGAGAIAPWMSRHVGLEIALDDPGLGDTSFEYEGVELSWKPHVKVDDAKDEPTDLGRIYFAVDDKNKRLVVWHIGLHL